MLPILTPICFSPLVAASCNHDDVEELFLPKNFQIVKIEDNKLAELKSKVNNLKLNGNEFLHSTTFKIDDNEKDYFLKAYVISTPNIEATTKVDSEKDTIYPISIEIQYWIIKKDHSGENEHQLVANSEKVVNINFQNFTLHSLNSIYNKFDAQKAFEYKNINWDILKNKYFDAEITDWSDGDTFKATVIGKDNANNMVEIGEEIKVRIDGIDTPEKAVNGKVSQDFEMGYAKLSSRFAIDTIPVGSKVRVIGDTKDSFGRIVGDAFFGDKYQYLYTLEIVRAGLTLPYAKLNNVINKIKNPIYLEHYSIHQMALAFNDAIKNRRGFFKTFALPEWASKCIYRQKPNTSWTDFWKRSRKNFFNATGLDLVNDSYKNKN